MSFLSVEVNKVSNELWRLIKEEWYSIEDDNEIELSNDCLDLRKDMLPPEECVSFNEGKGDNFKQKIFQVMEDLFLKMSMKESHLFAGIIDQNAYNKINKRKELISFQRDRGENNSHFGLYYLTDDESEILFIKSMLINILEDKLTTLIGSDEDFMTKLQCLKTRKKVIQKEIKRIKLIISNKINKDCTDCGVDSIQVDINKKGEIEFRKLDDISTEYNIKINESILSISPVKLAEFNDFPQDLDAVLAKISEVKLR